MDDLLHRANLHDSAGVHDGDPVAGLRNHAHVMGNEHDGGAAVLADALE